jgi:ADP-heptose:LPS heptosyltransferase
MLYRKCFLKTGQDRLKIRNIQSCKNILIIRDGRLGDVIMITPVIEWVKSFSPDSNIDVMVGQYATFILENNPCINDIIIYKKSNPPIRQLFFVLKLRGRYDAIIVLDTNSHYKILARIIGAKLRIGFSSKLDFLLDYHYCKWDNTKHAILNNLNVLKPFYQNGEFPSTDTVLYVKNSDIERAIEFLKTKISNPGYPIIFVQPACGASDVLRPWPQKNIAEICDLFIGDLDATVILHSGPGESEIVNKIVSLMKNNTIINEGDLSVTSALIKLSNLYIGPDTGTMHIANALKTPLIALLGPTENLDTGPLGPEKRISVIKYYFPCSPCINSTSIEKEKCIQQGFSDCMNDISIDEVYSKALKMLESNK